LRANYCLAPCEVTQNSSYYRKLGVRRHP
jgi:hypothetical protein